MIKLIEVSSQYTDNNVVYHHHIMFKYLARGFGMRVVGGKTGADGKLFAHIVWTVPGTYEILNKVKIVKH